MIYRPSGGHPMARSHRYLIRSMINISDIINIFNVYGCKRSLRSRAAPFGSIRAFPAQPFDKHISSPMIYLRLPPASMFGVSLDRLPA